MKKYDAFISYRHKDRDSWVAETIHKKLEHFHIPKEIQLAIGKKKINRVFRDKEELTLTDNLTQEIYDALDDSEFLIVICSPGSRESIWVDREVQYFLQHHDSKKLMVIHAGGELKEVLPECISGENAGDKEYLAANFCGDNRKNLTADQKDELLKMIAAMLGVNYDILKKRHQVYRRKQIALIAGIVIAALGIFGGYSAFQKHQLERVKRERLEQQAEMVSDTALDLLRSGDRDGALETVLSVREDDSSQRLVSVNQEFVLNEALNSYNTGKWIYYTPAGTVGEGIVEEHLSGNGQYLFTLDEENSVVCYSSDDESELWNLEQSKIEEKIEEEKHRYSNEVSAEIFGILPYDESKLLVICKNAVAVVSAQSSEIEMVFPVSFDASDTNQGWNKVRGDTLVGTDSRIIVSYDLNTGTQIESMPLSSLWKSLDIDMKDDFFDYLNIDCVDVNSSGTLYAFSMHDHNLDIMDEESNGEVYLYDTLKQTSMCLGSEEAALIEFVNDTQVAVIYKKISERIGAELGTHVTYQMVVYDSVSGEEIASSESISVKFAGSRIGMLCKQFQYSEGSFNGLVFYIDNRVFILDIDYGTTIDEISYESSITNLVDWDESSFLAGTDTGYIQRITVNDDISRKDFLRGQGDCQFFSAVRSNYNIAVLKNGQVVFYKLNPDSKLETLKFNGWNEADFNTIDTYQLKTGSFYCLKGKKDSATECFLLINSEDGKKRYSYTCEAGGELSQVKVYEEGGNTWISLLEENRSNPDNDTVRMFHRINIDTGEEYNIDLSDESVYYDSLSYDAEYSKIIFATYMHTCVVLSVNGSTVTERKELDLECSSCAYILSGDPRYMFIQYTKDGETLYQVYDLELDKYMNIKGISKSKDPGVFNNYKMRASSLDSKICLYDKQDVMIVDCSKHEVLAKINIGGGNTRDELDFSFFDNDQYLLISAPGKVLMYKSDTGQYISSVSYEAREMSPISNSTDSTLETGQSSNWFAISGRGGLWSSERGTFLDEMIIFYVDKDMKIYPYTEVIKGFADFENERVLLPVGKTIYTSAFYDQATLVEEAEALLARKKEQADDSVTETEENEEETDTDQVSDQVSDSNTSINQKRFENLFKYKKTADFNEMNSWDISENTSAIQAVDEGDAFVISLSDEQAEKIEKVVGNIVGVGEEDNNEILYYNVLSGRELQLNEENQIVFAKNQPILGIIDEENDNYPILRVHEENGNGLRKWSTRYFSAQESYYTFDLDNKTRNLQVFEESKGNLSYILNSDINSSILRDEEIAYVENAHHLKMRTRAADQSVIRNASGLILPVESWNNNYFYMVDSPVEFGNNPQIIFEGVEMFDAAFDGQVCIYYSDGTIQTTDLLPIKAEKNSVPEEYSMKDESGEWKFRVYTDHAVLEKFEGNSEMISIPSEVKGVPVTTIEKCRIGLNFDNITELLTHTIVIPKSVHTILRDALYLDRNVRIQLDDNPNFVVENGILMSSDGKRIICSVNEKVTDLNIPDGVESIDPHAFCRCWNLKNVHFPDGLKSIGSYAFADCSLKKLVLPEQVKYIGAEAFGTTSTVSLLIESTPRDIPELDVIRIGKNVHYIGSNAFSGFCVREFSVDPENTVYCSDEGVIYSKDKTILYHYPTGKNGAFTVPEGVEIVAKGAFEYSGYYSDEIPDSWGITELTLADSTGIVESGNIPMSDKLTKVIPGKNLSSWEGWKVLDLLELSEDSPIIRDEDGNYYNKDKTELISCTKTASEYTFPDTVTTIATSAFSGCDTLRKITISSDVNLEENSAEYFVSVLTNIYSLEIDEMEVGEGNPDFCMVDGKLMSASGKTVLCDLFKKDTSSGEINWKVAS